MLKLVATLAAFAALSANTVLAQAADTGSDTGLYLGAHYGQQKIDLESDFGNTNAKFGLVGVNLGYQLSPFLGIEARFAQGIEDEDLFSGLDAARFELDRHMALVAKGTLHLGQTLSVFGTAGYGETRYALAYEVLGADGRETNTEKGVQYGAGVALNLTNSLSVVAEYTRLPKLEEEDEGLFKSDVSLMTLGLQYRF